MNLGKKYTKIVIMEKYIMMMRTMVIIMIMTIIKIWNYLIEKKKLIMMIWIALILHLNN